MSLTELAQILIVSISTLCVGAIIFGFLPGTSHKARKLSITILSFLVAIATIDFLISNSKTVCAFFMWTAQMINTYWRNIVFAITALFIIGITSLVIFGAAMDWKEMGNNLETKEDNEEFKSAAFESQWQTESNTEREQTAAVLAIDNYIRQLQNIKKNCLEEKMRKRISNLELALLYVKKQEDAQPGLFKKTTMFLNGYMPTTIKLLLQYTKINQKHIKTENDKNAQMSIERSVDMVLVALKKQIFKVREMNVLDVTAESEAMQNTLMMNGYINTETLQNKKRNR